MFLYPLFFIFSNAVNISFALCLSSIRFFSNSLNLVSISAIKSLIFLFLISVIVSVMYVPLVELVIITPRDSKISYAFLTVTA